MLFSQGTKRAQNQCHSFNVAIFMTILKITYFMVCFSSQPIRNKDFLAIGKNRLRLASTETFIKIAILKLLILGAFCSSWHKQKKPHLGLITRVSVQEIKICFGATRWQKKIQKFLITVILYVYYTISTIMSIQ